MDSPLFRPVALAAAACSIVQASAWSVLGLLGLLAALGALGPSEREDSPCNDQNTLSEVFHLQIIGCYFPSDVYSECCTCNSLLTGHMMGISITYIIVSFIWMCVAVKLFQVLLAKKGKPKIWTVGWAAVTGVTSLLDLAVAIVFGIDYQTMINNSTCALGMYPTVPGFLMSLVARGYVLWVLNVAAAIFLGRCAAKGDNGSSQPNFHSSPADGLEDSAESPGNERGFPWESGAAPHNPHASSHQAHQPPPQPQEAPVSPWEPISAWKAAGGWVPEDDDDMASSSSCPSEAPYYPKVRTGALAARMGQPPPSSSTSHHEPSPLPPSQHGPPSHRGQFPLPPPSYHGPGSVAPPYRGPGSMAPSYRPPQSVVPSLPPKPQASGSRVPEPDYDDDDPPLRSALKNAPSSATPGGWRQQFQGKNQPSQPSMSSSHGRRENAPAASSSSRDRQNHDNSIHDGGNRRSYNHDYDNRGYDNRGFDNSSRQGNGANSAGQWGRKGF